MAQWKWNCAESIAARMTDSGPTELFRIFMNRPRCFIYSLFISCIISCIDALLCVLVGSKRTNCLRGGGLTGQEPVKESRKAKNSHCGMILGKHSFPIYSSMAPSLVLSEILFMFRSWMMTSCKWDLLLYCWLLPAEDDRGLTYESQHVGGEIDR